MRHVAPDHIGGQLFAFFSRNLMASPTVRMVSAASSGISQPNSSSKAMTSSTVSRLSAPRSSMKLAFSVTLSGSTPRCSTPIFLTRSPISLIVSNLFFQRDPINNDVSVRPSLHVVFVGLGDGRGRRRSKADAHSPALGLNGDPQPNSRSGYHTSIALASAAMRHEREP